MTVGHADALEGVELSGEQLAAVRKKVLISPADGWDGWVMRLFEVGPGGHTPRHSHDWPHINVVLDGEGSLHIDGDDQALRKGSFAFVPPGSLHQFTNTGPATFALVCIVPESGDV
jgi:quercetin dioxygenase-like cupin family protein